MRHCYSLILLIYIPRVNYQTPIYLNYYLDTFQYIQWNVPECTTFLYNNGTVNKNNVCTWMYFFTAQYNNGTVNKNKHNLTEKSAKYRCKTDMHMKIWSALRQLLRLWERQLIGKVFVHLLPLLTWANGFFPLWYSTML